jgi:hypothetical protein
MVCLSLDNRNERKFIMDDYHISKQVRDVLIDAGWIQKTCFGSVGMYFEKYIKGIAPAGSFSNGNHFINLEIDSTGRWFSIVDGWGKVERDVDLRCFNSPVAAILVLFDLENSDYGDLVEQIIGNNA